MKCSSYFKLHCKIRSLFISAFSYLNLKSAEYRRTSLLVLRGSIYLALMLEFKRRREETAAIMILSWIDLYIAILKTKKSESYFSNLICDYLPELDV